MPSLSGNLLNKKLAFFIVFLALVMLATSGMWGVIETSEARYAEIAREMYLSGDWMHPRLMNIYHYHKPPVTYWLTAVAYWTFGINVFAVRFFLTIAFCIQVFLVFRIAHQLFGNEQAAYYAAVVYATLPIVLISVRGLTTDAYLMTFVLLTVHWWMRFLETHRGGYLWGMAVAAGLGFLTKGPVALVLPLFAMIGLRKYCPKPRIGAMRIFFAVLIFLTVSFSWFAVLTLEDPAFADYFFFRHVLDRVAHAEVFARAEPWYYYLPLLPVVYLPWITTVAGRVWKEDCENKQRPLVKSILIWWFFGPLALFSLFTSKLVLYILPLSIGFSLIAGYAIHLRGTITLKWVVAGLIFVVYAGLLLIPFLPGDYNYSPGMLVIPLLGLVITVGTLFFSPGKELLISLWSLLFASALMVYSALFFKLNSIQVNSTAAIATFIQKNGLRERDILICNEILPSLAFELNRDIIAVDAGTGPLKRETRFEQNDRWRDFLIKATDGPGNMKLRAALSTKAVVIAKKQLAPAISAVMKGQWQEKRFGKWIVYYN